MAIIQPTRSHLLVCNIGGLDYKVGEHNNFHVQELRIFEDHCKFYFTGELVIEAHQNTWEDYIQNGMSVTIGFRAPRTDGGPTKDYYENFVIFSYQSRHREDDRANAMVITISLIGQEYFNDQYNTVQQAFSNIPGSAAAAAIHQAYIDVIGGLNPFASMGLIGQTLVPHEVNNKKPSKAIWDILNKSVWAAYPSCAPTYFRTKNGYVMAPLQALLETAAITESFIHNPNQGDDYTEVAKGYNRIDLLRPMSPPGEDRGSDGGSMDGLFSATSFLDIKTGNYEKIGMNAGKIVNSLAGGVQKVASSLASSAKSSYGGRNSFAVLDDLHQARSVAKNGPGGFQSAQDAFVTALRYCPKYWVSVPLQTGVNVTCGDRINITYPVGTDGNRPLVSKTVYVPRLIHELKFTQGKDREGVTIVGTSDMFTVFW